MCALAFIYLFCSLKHTEETFSQVTDCFTEITGKAGFSAEVSSFSSVVSISNSLFTK